MMKLNLGCGRDQREGYINVDISQDVGADKVFDLTKGIPFPIDTFDEVLCLNVLTQVHDAKTYMKVMNDLWHITKPSGDIVIRVPNAKDICAFQDPMDCRRFTPESFTYMEIDHRRFEQYGKHYGFLPFKVDLIEDNGVQMIFNLRPVKGYELEETKKTDATA